MHHPEVVETVIKGLVGLYETFKARVARPLLKYLTAVLTSQISLHNPRLRIERLKLAASQVSSSNQLLGFALSMRNPQSLG
jgi:hypothetical protein